MDHIFVYLGGQQEVPNNADVRHVIIDRSVKKIPARAFQQREYLVSVETHDEIGMIVGCAFNGCNSLRRIKLPGVRKVGNAAFWGCEQLSDVEFGDKLETIRGSAFNECNSLQNIKMPTVRTIERSAFGCCKQLTDVEMPAVDIIEHNAFAFCRNLQRIAIPLKDNMFTITAKEGYTQFNECDNLATVDLVGGIHKTISSLLLESWKVEMNHEIDRINRRLPNTPSKTYAIQQWIRSVIRRMEHYKAEHNTLLKEAMTLLELAVWKAKLEEDEEDDSNLKGKEKKAMIDMKNARKERRITSGADINIIISNVLPFLQLLE